jgi:hypothetical protein
MVETKIYIDNYEIDLGSDNSNISNNYSIESMSDLENSSDCTTKTINVPDTKKNRIIFNFPDDLTITNNDHLLFNQKVHTGIIEEGGTRTMKGVVKLLEVTGVPGNKSISFTIIGNSKEWVEYFRKHKLTDLVGLGGMLGPMSGYGHFYSKSSIELAEDGSKKYIYPLINTVNNLSDIHHVRVEDLDVFLFVKNILSSCFTKAGFKVVSNFTSTDFFARLIMSGNMPKKDPAYIEQRLFKVGLFQSQLVDTYRPFIAFDNEGITNILGETTEFYDKNNLFANNYYQGDIGCATRFCAKIRLQKFYDLQYVEEVPGYWIDGIGPEGPIWIAPIPAHYVGYSHYPQSVEIQLVNEVTPGQNPVIVQTKMFNVPADDQTNYGNPVDLLCEFDSFMPDPTKKYGIRLLFPYSNTIGDGLTIMLDGTEFYNEIDETPMEGEFLSIDKILPDWYMLDFVKALKQLFNLKFITDVESRTVYFEPRDQFYVRNKTVDISKLMDLSKEVSVLDLGDDIGKKIRLRYADDTTDAFVSKTNEASGVILAEHIAENKSVHATEETPIQNNIFGPTLMAIAPNYGLKNTKIPKINGVQDTEIRLRDYSPRILFYAGVQNCLGGDYWFLKDSQRNTYCRAYSIADEPNDNSLFFNSVGAIRGLFEKFYFNSIKTINDSKRIGAYFNINSGLVNNLICIDNDTKKDYRAMFTINVNNENIKCRLEKINDYSPGTRESTNMVLVKDVDRIQLNITPSIVRLVPQHNSTSVPVDTNLFIQFDMAVVIGSGSIRIKRITDNLLVEAINVTNVTFTDSAHTIVKVNPTSNLGINTAYYIDIDSTAFVSAQNISFGGLSGMQRWKITTGAIQLMTEVNIISNTGNRIFYGQAPTWPLCMNVNSNSYNGVTADENTIYQPSVPSDYNGENCINEIKSTRYLTNQYRIRRGFFYFNTSSIPANAIIESAELYIFIRHAAAQLTAQKGTQIAAPSVNDVTVFTSYSGVSYGDTGPITDNNFAVIQFNETGRNDIVKGGITKICLREKNNDFVNSAPVNVGTYDGTKIFLNNAPAGKETYLKIKYHL